MELLYLHEHQSCQNYISDFKSGFSVKNYSKNDTFKLELKKEFAVLFVENGSLSITHESFENRIVSADELSMLAYHSDYECKVLEDCVFTVLFFEKPKNQCDKLSLQMLSQYLIPSTDKIRTLPMRVPVKAFIDGMKLYLSSGMYCRHLHDMKECEWLFLMRGFYTKEESAYFFEQIIKAFSNFSNLVKDNYMHVNSVNDLAKLCNMTVKTFTRKFREEFNDTPKQWMLAEKIRRIKADMNKKELTVNELSYKYGFHSPSHFNHFLSSKLYKKEK